MIALALVVVIFALIVGFGDRADQKHENPPVKGMTRVQKWSFGAAAIAAVYVIWALSSLDDGSSTTYRPASTKARTGPCTYNVTVSFDETYNDSVGSDWEFYATVNGKTVTNGGVDVTCDVGDHVDLYAQCVEEDVYPDTGEDSSYIVIHKDDLWSSFTVTQDIIVTEDYGRYAGNTAEFAVTFTFEPVE